MFTINNLTFGYGGIGKGAKAVLKGVSLEVPSASVSGIIGYNGAGKTTLLDAIYGLVAAPREVFVLDGRTLKRENVAYLQAQNFFYSGITGRDYLELFRSKGRANDLSDSSDGKRDSIEMWGELLSLPLDESIENYSTGMRKKLALAGVLMLDKEMVMLDEPFNGLDVEAVAILQRILRRLADRGRTVIVTSHIIESLTGVCDRLALLREGRIEKMYGRDEFESLAEFFCNEIDRKYNILIDRVL
jgi:ABC-2 type transport system ATP-binding protein